MIQLAEQNNPTATFKVLDALKIHELNDLFDAIIVGFCCPILHLWMLSIL
jgi:hypothetical protein